jgi:hypothetical protein
MPVHCCAMATPIPAMKRRRTQWILEVLPTPHLRLFFFLVQELDFFHLGAGPLLRPDLHEDLESLVVAVL